MDLRGALELGHDLMAEHGLDDWTLGLDRAKTRAGATHWSTRQITLSAPITVLHDESEVRDTLLHEIAHALAGARAGHGPRWRTVARSIGCSAQRCLSADTPVVEGDWVGRCAAGHSVSRHRTPTRVVSCTRCHRGFSPNHLLQWTFRGEQVPMHPTYTRDLTRLSARPAPTPSPGATAPVVVGDRVRVIAPGRYADVVGTVSKRGRTRWHVRVRGGTLTVPFGLVTPVDGPEERRPVVEQLEEVVRSAQAAARKPAPDRTQPPTRPPAPAATPVAQTLFDL